MSYVIEVTPSNKNFPKHIWKEGGIFSEKHTAEFQAAQMRKMKCEYDGRKNFYSKVEVILNQTKK